MIVANPLNPQNAGAVPATRTINGKALSSDITLAAADVGALPLGGTATDSQKLGGISAANYRTDSSVGFFKASIANDTSVSSTEPVAFSLTEAMNIGGYFSLSGTTITVLKPCRILFSAAAYFYTGFAGVNNNFLDIKVNGSNLARISVRTEVANPYISGIIPATLATVAAGDKITYTVCNGSSGKLGGMIKAYAQNSYINIVVI